MFGNIVPLTTVGGAQVLPTNNMGNNDLVIIQDTSAASTQAELINQLQNHITENQQILIITDDQGQDQCKIHSNENSSHGFISISFQMSSSIKIKISMHFYKMVNSTRFFFRKISQFKNDEYNEERIDDTS